MLFLLLFTFIICDAKYEGEDWKRPNIVFIIADDMGWDDVSFHGSDQIITPNIDLLAYTGIPLERYYSHSICTPSRSAFLTGKYSHVIGMQGYPLTNSEDRGLPVTEKILPQYLKELGYATHLIGKWHVGESRKHFLPTMRGFDTHYGHRGGFIDYYEYTLQEEGDNGDISGFGLFRNMTAAWGDEGYITDLYTKEAKTIIMSHDENIPLFLQVSHNAPHSGNDDVALQAPPEVVRSMRHIESPQRRIYAGMVKKLDDSVGEIVQALLNKGILHNTIIVFVSDNGGITSGSSMNYASNWPLRGLKLTPFEGGIRVNALIWTQNLTDSRPWKEYFHIADWLPTLMRAIGAEPPLEIDGLDLWDNVIENTKSKRTEMFEIDDFSGFSSIISGDYKLVTGHINVTYGNYQGGGDLRNVIGMVPSYQDNLRNCAMYEVLNNIGKPFNFEKTNIRNELRVNCDDIEQNDEKICYPQTGLWCLFNIKKDPCETTDISSENPDIVQNMLNRLQTEMKRVIPRNQVIYRDPRSSPRLLNYTWDVWADDIAS